MHFGANPVNPPLLGQPQMQGLAPVITTAGMMQPPLHAINQLAASQYPQNDTTAVSGLTYNTARDECPPLQWRCPPLSITSPTLVEKAQGTTSTLRPQHLGDVEMSFDKVMEEVRETNPMTILKKVSYKCQHNRHK